MKWYWWALIIVSVAAVGYGTYTMLKPSSTTPVVK